MLLKLLPDVESYVRREVARVLENFKSARVRAALLAQLSVETDSSAKGALIGVLEKNYPDDEEVKKAIQEAP